MWGFEHLSQTPRSTGQMIDFRDVLEVCGLSDLGFSGVPYTYDNRRAGRAYVKVRLDRAVANDGWCTQFPDFWVINGDPRHSDHRPVVVTTEQGAIEAVTRDTTFRFEARWMQEDGFDEVIKKAWEESWAEGAGEVSRALAGVARN